MVAASGRSCIAFGALLAIAGCGRLLGLSEVDEPETFGDAAAESGERADAITGSASVDGGPDGSGDAQEEDATSEGGTSCVESSGCAAKVQDCCSKTNGGGVCGGVCVGGTEICCL